MAIKLALIVLGLVAICTGKSIEDSPFENALYPYPRIVGGEVAADGERPEILAIRSGIITRSLVCGASLVSVRVALTAAHCNDAISSNIFFNRVYVAAGSNSHSSGREYQCSSYLNHPDWNSNQIKSDVGLLFLRDSVELSDRVRTIVIHQPAAVGGESAVFYGWGRTVAGGAGSAVLKKLITTVLSHEECVERRNLAQQNYPGNLPNIDQLSEVCTYHSVGNGACHGDSGSPLVLEDTNLQIGTVSWGVPCAIGGPDVFGRVSNFASWILANQGNFNAE